jgi:hypothetical protein
MEDIQQQLAALRRRIAHIGRASDLPAPAPKPKPPRCSIEDLVSGEVVKTSLGEHFETERVWERHRRHGSVDISDLAGKFAEETNDRIVTGEALMQVDPPKWELTGTVENP